MYDNQSIDLVIAGIKTAQELLPLLQDPKKVSAFINGAEQAKENLANSAEINKRLEKAEKLEVFNAAEDERLEKIKQNLATLEAGLEAKKSDFAAIEAENKERLKQAKAIEKANAEAKINIEAREKAATVAQAAADEEKAEATRQRELYLGKLNTLNQLEAKNG